MLRGNPQSLRDYAKRMQRVASPSTVERIVREGSSVLTAQLQSDFDSGNTAYGDARPSGRHGPVTLRKTGRLASFLRFAAVGRLMRAVLAVPYARFMIGRFQILPRGGGKLPYKWSEQLGGIARRVMSDTMRGVG